MAKLNSVLVPAGTVTKDSVVLVNLSGPGATPSDRISVNESLTLGVLGVDPETEEEKAPEFPSESIADVNNSDISASEKAALIEEICAEYKEVAEAFTGSGGKTLPDRIISAVTEWLVNEKGFSKDTSAQAPVIKDGELVCSTVMVNNTALFTINGSAVWG